MDGLGTLSQTVRRPREISDRERRITTAARRLAPGRDERDALAFGSGRRDGGARRDAGSDERFTFALPARAFLDSQRSRNARNALAPAS